MTVRYERIPAADARFGRHISHDPQSRRYAYPFTSTALSAVRWTRRAPIWDQGQVGSCTGNAALGCLATDPYYNTVANQARYPFTEAGAVSVYSAATGIDEVDGTYPPDDTGSSGLAVAKVLRNAGLIAGYRHAFGIGAVLAALQHGPVIAGTVWLDGMDQPDSAGLVRATGQVLGGHEYILDEYVPGREMVGCTNSWGPSWALGGRFYLHVEDLADLLDRDGDVTVFTPNTQPAPQPTPIPVPPISADETFARVLHRWLDSRPRSYLPLQQSAEAWLVGKHL